MDPYDVLGAPPWASAEELHSAYRARARELHPDSGGSDEAMQALNDAWAVLGDPELRAEYDALFHAPPRWVRRVPILAILAVLLAIFVLTAYAATPPR